MARKKKKQRQVDLASTKMPGIPLMETGSSGIQEFQGFVTQAYNQALFWPGCYKEYNRLRRSMPEMGMVRQLFTVLSRAVSPSIEQPEHPTDDDKRYADFVSSEFDNIEGGFSSFIEMTVSQVPFMGWGRWNMVPSIRDVNWRPPQKGDDWQSEEDDGLKGIRRLAWRDQGTLEKWEFDEHKKMVGMWQIDAPKPSIYLPNKICLHLTFGDPFNPEGLAPLEAIYRLERIRFGFEVIMGIGFEHAAGYLDVTKTEGNTLSPEDIRHIETAAMNILTAKEGNYAAWPPGIEGKIKDVGFQAAVSILNAIEHYNILALSVYLAQFIAFNTLSGTGSYASSSDSSQIAINAFNGMMDGFASQIDRQLGRYWWDNNKEEFPGVTKRPRLKFTHVTKDVQLGVLGQFIGQIKDTIPLGEDDLVAIRKYSGFLPETLPEDKEVINKQTVEEPQPPQPNPFQVGGKDVQPMPQGKEINNQFVTPLMREAMAVYSRGNGNGNGYNGHLDI